MKTKHYSYSVEITSVLEALFAAATVKKLSKNSMFKPHSILLYVANDHVNEETINISLSILKIKTFTKKKVLKFHDMRKKKTKLFM